jgi:hypothetical protein
MKDDKRLKNHRRAFLAKRTMRIEALKRQSLIWYRN